MTRLVKRAAVISTLWISTLAAQGERATPDAISRAVDSLATRIVSGGLTPALGVAVVMNGKTIHARSYGWADVTKRIAADDRTLWYIASTTKSFTGFGIALLATQGVLRLEQPISELLPRAEWYRGVDPRRITLAQFLSHTHYLNDNAVVMSAAFTGEIPEARWPQLIRFVPPAGNSNLVYSNFGYNVAAMVIDAKRPEGWRRFLDSAVYRPAGMLETFARTSGLDRRRIAMPHRLGADGAFTTSQFQKTDATMNSAGGHLATLHDLARWTIVQMDQGVIDGNRVFPAEAVALSHRLIAPHTVQASKQFGPFSRDGWAAGWDIGTYDGEPMVSRFGGYMTIRSHLSFLPRRGIGVVAQATGTGASSTTDIVAQLAYDMEIGKPNARALATERVDALISRRPAGLMQIAAADSTRRARQGPMDRPLTDFLGSYTSEALGTITFILRGDVLHFMWGAISGPAEVFDAARRQLRVEVAGTGTTIAFEFAASGPARAITLNGETFKRR
jgi:CubicO group peptidase (beta-lactamase class C family)